VRVKGRGGEGGRTEAREERAGMGLDTTCEKCQYFDWKGREGRSHLTLNNTLARCHQLLSKSDRSQNHKQFRIGWEGIPHA
jgi:hypothetical protein